VRQQIVRARYDPFALARWFSEAAQAPLLAPFQIGWWNAIRDAARQDGIKLLLTGELGNLSLNAGALPMLSALARSGRWPKALRESRLLVRRGAIRWRGAAAAVLDNRLPEPLYAWLRQQLASGPPPRPLLFLRKDVVLSTRAAPPAGTHGQRLAAIQRSDFGVQRIIAEQHWGMSEMDPMADRALLEWSLRLPIEALLRDGLTRPVAREALHGSVPATVLDNHRRGLQGADWYQLVSASDCQAVLAEIRERPLVRDFLDIAAIEQALGQWPSSDWNSLQNYVRFRIGLVNALCAGLFVSRFAP
jgi:asparagine synthase (glutamine-hydrolysing)